MDFKLIEDDLARSCSFSLMEKETLCDIKMFLELLPIEKTQEKSSEI